MQSGAQKAKISDKTMGIIKPFRDMICGTRDLWLEKMGFKV